MATPKSLRRREIARQIREYPLVKMDRLIEILEAMFAEILQTHLCWYIVCHQIASGLREQHLPTMAALIIRAA